MTSCFLNKTNWRITSIKTVQQWKESPSNLFTNCLSWACSALHWRKVMVMTVLTSVPLGTSPTLAPEKEAGLTTPRTMQWLKRLWVNCCLSVWFWESYLPFCIILGDLLCYNALIEDPDPWWCTGVTWVWILPVPGIWFAHWFMIHGKFELSRADRSANSWFTSGRFEMETANNKWQIYLTTRAGQEHNSSVDLSRFSGCLRTIFNLEDL